MDIKNLEVRMYYLAGQLEEAKKIYKDAMGEIERANKEQAEREAKAAVANNDKAVSEREQVTA